MAKKQKKSADQLNETGNRVTERRNSKKSVDENKRKVQRRRLIDPTTCERDYSQDEIEFMQAMDEYKRTSGRMFPTCSEILEVLREMGYRRLSAEELACEMSANLDVCDSFAADDLEEEEFESITELS